MVQLCVFGTFGFSQCLYFENVCRCTPCAVCLCTRMPRVVERWGLGKIKVCKIKICVVSVYPCVPCVVEGGVISKIKIGTQIQNPKEGESIPSCLPSRAGGVVEVVFLPAILWVPGYLGMYIFGNCRSPKSRFYRQHLLYNVLPISQLPLTLQCGLGLRWSISRCPVQSVQLPVLENAAIAQAAIADGQREMARPECNTIDTTQSTRPQRS